MCMYAYTCIFFYLLYACMYFIMYSGKDTHITKVLADIQVGIILNFIMVPYY